MFFGHFQKPETSNLSGAWILWSEYFLNVRKSRISAIMKTGDWFDVWRQIFSKEGTRIERIHFHKKISLEFKPLEHLPCFQKNPLRTSLTWYATYYMSGDHMYPYHPVNSVKAYRIRRTQYLKRWQSDNFIQKLKIFRRIWTIKKWCILLGRRFASYLTDFDRLEALELSDFPAVNKYFMLKKHDGR